jgi:hypothetical protein
VYVWAAQQRMDNSAIVQTNEPSEPKQKDSMASAETSDEFEPPQQHVAPRVVRETPMEEIDRWIAEITLAGARALFPYFLVSPVSSAEESAASQSKRRNSVMLLQPTRMDASSAGKEDEGEKSAISKRRASVIFAKPPRLEPASPQRAASPVAGESPGEERKSGLGRVMRGLTRGRSSSDVAQLKRLSVSGESKAAPAPLSRSSDKVESVISSSPMASDLAEKRASLQRLYDSWKGYEKLCEAVMTAIISKEKGGSKGVPHDKVKLEGELESSARRVKSAKAMFLMEKQNLRNLCDKIKAESDK